MLDLVVDVGQSAARARLLRDGLLASESHNLPGYTSGADITHSLEDIVAAAAQALGSPRMDRVAIGSTGLFGSAPGLAQFGQNLHLRHGVTLLRVADDGVTAFLGALNGRHGALVAAGTGIVAFAWGPHGAARADGVGAMLGDNGSGWWIGRAGLIAAMSAADGRAPSSLALLEAAVTRYGPRELIPRTIATASSPVRAVAAFARDVANVARAGDKTAALIWQTAGSYIADSILAVAARGGLGSDLHWGLLGNLALASDLLDPTLNARILERHEQAIRVPPVGDALDGVATLLKLPELAGFHALVSEFDALDSALRPASTWRP